MTRDPSNDASASGQLPAGAVELPRMLIVEDNDQHRRELVAHFTDRGWSVEATRTFRAALAIARRHLPVVIVTELLLPDVRGYRFAQEYRDAVGKSVVVVAVTRIPSTIFENAAPMIKRWWPAAGRAAYCDLMASSNYMFDHMRSKEARSTHYQDMHEACYPFINSWKV